MPKHVQIGLVRKNNRWEGAIVVDGKMDGVVVTDEPVKDLTVFLLAPMMQPAEGQRVTYDVTIEDPDVPTVKQ